jgi:hypothetical protein
MRRRLDVTNCNRTESQRPSSTQQTGSAISCQPLAALSSQFASIERLVAGPSGISTKQYDFFALKGKNAGKMATEWQLRVPLLYCHGFLLRAIVPTSAAALNVGARDFAV